MPAPVGSVTVTFRDRALAAAGMSQLPATAKARKAPATRAGPARGPSGVSRVSTTRQGVTVKKAPSTVKTVGSAGPTTAGSSVGAEASLVLFPSLS